MQLMKMSQSNIEDLKGTSRDLWCIDLHLINDDLFSFKNERIDIHAYASFLNFQCISCAKMAWEFSNNRISSLEFRRYKAINEAIADCYSTALSLAKKASNRWDVPWIIAANLQFHKGDFDELPEEIISVGAEEIWKNNDSEWWFQYDIAIVKKRSCAYLEELDISGDDWNKSHAPVRFVLAV